MADREPTTDCMWCRYGDHPSGPNCPVHQGTEAQFLQDMINTTAGWRLDGYQSERETLRGIEAMCRQRLAMMRMVNHG